MYSVIIIKLHKKDSKAIMCRGLIEDAACLGWSELVDGEIWLNVGHYKTSGSCFVWWIHKFLFRY